MPHFRTSCQRPLGPGVPLLAVRRFVASAHAMLLPRRLLGALRPRRGSATCRAASPWLHPTAKHPIGARSCASDATPAAPPRYDAAIISLRAASFGQPAGVAEARALAAARLVVFGEIHSMPPCIELLQRTAASMMSDAAAAGGTLHVVLEHLNFEQQPLLDAYLVGLCRLTSATVEHEATTSKISEDQLFYCMSRGLSTEDAVGLIVNGFCKEVMKELPMEFAVEAQKLIGISLEGSVG